MAQGSLRIAAIAAAMALCACTGPQGPAPTAPPTAATAPTPPPPPPPAAPAPPPKPRDSCGAAALQYLVGRPRTEIPVPVNPAMRRVVCSTCMITQDLIPGRQTITYDVKTGLVMSVRCG